MEQQFSILLYVNAKSTADRLKKALESVRSNSICPAEIITIVCGSVSDELRSVLDNLKSYPNFYTYYYPVDYDRATALRLALSKCSYELVALQDVNAISLPDRFEKQLAYFEKNPQTAVLGGRCEEVDVDSLLPTVIRKEPKIQTLFDTFTSVISQTVLFKKSVILDVGGYKPFPYFENAYLWARIIEKGYQIANLTDILVRVPVSCSTQIVAGPYFQLQKKLFYQMYSAGLMSRFSYYQLVSTCFIKYLFLPRCLRNLWSDTRWILD